VAVDCEHDSHGFYPTNPFPMDANTSLVNLPLKMAEVSGLDPQGV
jgi:hypothetical protein